MKWQQSKRSQQFPEMLMREEQSFVRLGTTRQSNSALSQGEERYIHHGIHRITSTFTLEIHSAKTDISPSVAAGQKCGQSGIPLPFHNLKLCFTFSVTLGLQVPLKAEVCYQEGGKSRRESVPKAINQLWPKQWSNSYWYTRLTLKAYNCFPTVNIKWVTGRKGNRIFAYLKTSKQKRLPHDQKEFWNNNKMGGRRNRQLPTETDYFLTVHTPLNSESKM